MPEADSFAHLDLIGIDHEQFETRMEEGLRDFRASACKQISSNCGVFRPAIAANKRLNIRDLFPELGNDEVLVTTHYPEYSDDEARRFAGHPLWYTRQDNRPLTHNSLASTAPILTPSEGAIALVHESTAQADQFQDYLKELLGYQPEMVSYANDYRDRFKALCQGRRVVTQVPYIPEVIGTELDYASDHELAAVINNKDFLDQVVPSYALPKRFTGLCISTSAVMSTMMANQMDFPVVLKGGGGINGGGNAVRIVDNHLEMVEALEMLRAQNCNNVTIEDYFEHDRNEAIHLVVQDQGVQFLGHSRQLVNDGGNAYSGNVLALDEARNPYSLPHALWQTCFESGLMMKALGYRGMVGLDALYDSKSGQVRVIDPNARVNASSPILALLPRIIEISGQSYGSLEYIKKEVRASINEVMVGMRGQLHRGEAFMLGAASEGRMSKVSMAILGDTAKRDWIKSELEKISG